MEQTKTEIPTPIVNNEPPKIEFYLDVKVEVPQKSKQAKKSEFLLIVIQSTGTLFRKANFYSEGA